MVVRADREHRTPVNSPTEELIISAVKTAIESAHALIVSDYDKGVGHSSHSRRGLAGGLRSHAVLIDPKMRNFNAYRPATLVTPNHHEALRVAGLEEDSDVTLRQAAQLIRACLAAMLF